MKGVTRQEIFAQAAKKLRQDFASLSVVPHAGLKGGEAEELVRKFLKGHLPKRFDVGSGFIIDPKNNISKQTDVIVYDAMNCPVYRASDTAAIIPSDNTAAVVEIKSRLDKEQMQDAFKKTVAVKGLTKTAPPKIPMLITTQTFSCLFAFETPLTLQKLAEHYVDCVKEHGLGRHIDLILVLDKGIINLAAKMPEIDGWNPIMMEGLGGDKAEGAHLAVGATEMGEDSLDMFLRLLLAHLIPFRGRVGHPGFSWDRAGTPSETLMTYLTSITNEKDPALREKKLRQYAKEVVDDFAHRPAPKDSQPNGMKEAPPAATTPTIIHLPSSLESQSS